MNIECDQKVLDELTGAFRFSDAVLRHLVVNMDAAVTEPSRWRKPRMRKVMVAAVIVRVTTVMVTMTARRVVVRVKKQCLPRMTRTARSEKAPEGARIDCNGV